MANPDKIFETWVYRLVPIWGPFYAVFYIIRLMWVEFFGHKD